MDHAELQQPDAEPRQVVVVQAEDAERLAEVQVGLARRDDPDPAVRPGAADPVDAAGAYVLHRHWEAHVEQVALQPRELAAEQAGAGAVRVRPGRTERGRRRRRRVPVPADDRGVRGVGDVGDHLHRRPDAAGTRQFHHVQPVVQQILRIGGVEGRHGEVGKGELGRAGHRGRLGVRVVAHQSHRTTGGVGAGEVGMPERVARPIQPGGLAVPPAHHTARPPRARELAAHHRRRGQLLVQPGPMHHVVAGEQARAPGQLQIEPGEGRTFVAGDERRGVHPSLPVLPDHVEQDPHQSLYAGEIDGPLLPEVAVVQGEAGRRGTR